MSDQEVARVAKSVGKAVGWDFSVMMFETGSFVSAKDGVLESFVALG